MRLLGNARTLVERAGAETEYAATLLHARGPGIALTPPHKMAGAVRDLASYGPLVGAFTLAVAGFGSHSAIVDERGALTYADLDRRSNALAHALLDNGFGSGDGVGILMRNHRHLYESIIAAGKLGARTLLLNTDFAGPQLADVCAREGVSVLLHDAEFRSVAAAAAAPGGRYVAWIGDGLQDGDTTVESLVAAGSARRPRRPRRRQRIVLLTSGTTGAPKGAPRDLALSLAVPGGYLSRIPLRSGRTVVLAAPGFHAWGLSSSMIALGLGSTLVMARRNDPQFILSALDHHRADTLITVPILLARLLDLGEAHLRHHDLAALRVVAVSGSTLAPDLAARALDVLGDVIYNLYGSTEVAYATIATPRDLRAAPGTVGRPPRAPGSGCSTSTTTTSSRGGRGGSSCTTSASSSGTPTVARNRRCTR